MAKPKYRPKHRTAKQRKVRAKFKRKARHEKGVERGVRDFHAYCRVMYRTMFEFDSVMARAAAEHVYKHWNGNEFVVRIVDEIQQLHEQHKSL